MLSDGRKVVESFLFSEPFEKEVLLTKLHAEDPVVDEFVAIEGEFTFRGEHKGCHLQSILDQDERFARFRHKVKVISCKENLFCGPHDDAGYFKVEFASRELSREYLSSKYSDNDLITCTDVDELLDFSDDWRRSQLDAILTGAARQKKIAYIRMLKFWYDFDNVSRERKWFPIGPLGVAKQFWRMRQAPSHLYNVYSEPRWLAFEYSFCFPKPFIMRKLTTFSHAGYTEADVKDALKRNYWVKSASKGQRPGERDEDFFEKTELTRLNSTQYVRDNLLLLKTNNVG